jgi:DNA-binding winged helix-turn-helix (wHTH) protein
MQAADLRTNRTSIDLATTPSFKLGDLQVQPARRMISWGTAQHRELQPRVMQVFVALASESGEIVSRDRLIERCWDGRIVGDDAINRCIQAIRRLSKEITPTPFFIETVARVGYSMTFPTGAGHPVIYESIDKEQHSPWNQTSAKRSTILGFNRLVVASILLVTLAGLALYAFLKTPEATSTARLAVVAQPNTGSEALARRIETDILQFINARGGFMVVTSKPGNANFVLQIEDASSAAVEALGLRLMVNSPAQMLWSTFVQQEGSVSARSQVSAKVNDVLLCAKRGLALPRETLRLYLSACERMTATSDQQLIALLEQVAREAPEFAWVWGDLAVAEANRLMILRHSAGRNDPETKTVLNKVRNYIDQSQKLNPELPAIFFAEHALLPPGEYSGQLNVLEQGLKNNSEEPLLYSQYSRSLFKVGRLAAAIEAAEKAAALDPLSLEARATLVDSLAHAGSIRRARKELAVAEQLWPKSERLMRVLFSIELRYGNPAVAQRLIDNGEAGLEQSVGGFGGQELLMKARLDPTPENLNQMVRFMSDQTRRFPRAVPIRVQALGHAGAVEEFYELVRQPGVIPYLQGASEILFRPHLKVFRDD